MSRAADDVINLIAASVREVANRTDTALAPMEAGPVAKAITDKIAPAVLHATNNEPWYQSRVTWGAIISVGTGLLSVAGIATDWLDPQEAVALGVSFGTVIGGAITLWGRWKARKPILSAAR